MIRLMTFNIRFDNEDDGDNSWIHRRDLVTGIVRKYKPAILGTQEGMVHQLIYMRDDMPEYGMHAPGRIPDASSQYPTLYFYRKEFNVLEGDEFWLSKTPRTPLSKDWDSGFPRMMSYGLFGTSGQKPSIWIAVTHLDHVSDRARYEQARIIANWVRTRSGPIIIMGDFNDHPGSRVHRMLTSPDTGLRDTWQVLGLPEDSEGFTHHGFKGIPQKTRMDWILVGSHFHVESVRIIRDNIKGSYPSDHYPYMVDVTVSP